MSIVLLDNIIFLSGSANPDSVSIANKEQVDISVSLTDIRITDNESTIRTNYSATMLEVIVGSDATEHGSVYYTPLYTEKLNYNEWLSIVNKNFQELN